METIYEDDRKYTKPNAKWRGFGICEACNEGNTIYSMNDEVFFSEVTAIEVDGFEGLLEPFIGKTIKGGRYAVFTHKGSLTSLSKTYDYIWGTII